MLLLELEDKLLAFSTTIKFKIKTSTMDEYPIDIIAAPSGARNSDPVDSFIQHNLPSRKFDKSTKPHIESLVIENFKSYGE